MSDQTNDPAVSPSADEPEGLGVFLRRIRSRKKSGIAKRRMPRHILTALQVDTWMASIDEEIQLATRDNLRKAVLLERTRFAIDVVLRTGVRLGELMSLRVEDVQLDLSLPGLERACALRVVGTKGQGRCIRVAGPAPAGLFEHYLTKVRPKLLQAGQQDPGWLLLSERGQRMNPVQFGAAICKTASQAIPFKVTHTILRRTCTTQMMQAGIDTDRIRQVMGYKAWPNRFGDYYMSTIDPRIAMSLFDFKVEDDSTP